MRKVATASIWICYHLVIIACFILQEKWAHWKSAHLRPIYLKTCSLDYPVVGLSDRMWCCVVMRNEEKSLKIAQGCMIQQRQDNHQSLLRISRLLNPWKFLSSSTHQKHLRIISYQDSEKLSIRKRTVRPSEIHPSMPPTLLDAQMECSVAKSLKSTPSV